LAAGGILRSDDDLNFYYKIKKKKVKMSLIGDEGKGIK